MPVPSVAVAPRAQRFECTVNKNVGCILELYGYFVGTLRALRAVDRGHC